jgi:hypothetical protein
MASRRCILICRFGSLVAPATTAAVGLVFLSTWAALITCGAEKQPRTIPKDGAWVRYHSSCERSNGFKASRKVTLSFVGTVDVDNKHCRWVEIKVDDGDDEQKKEYLFKMLVLEDDLMQSDLLALKNVIRTWERRPDGTVINQPDAPNYSELFLWTPGAMRNFESTGESKDISFERGRLKSAKAWSRLREDRGQGSGIRTNTTFMVWMHPDVALGYAEASMRMNISFGGEQLSDQLTKYEIEDAGTGAMTELPKNN